MNDDLISREKLKSYIKQNGPVYANTLDTIPAVDPVHASGGCYCRECRFWICDAENPKCYCARLSDDNYTVYTDQDDFCSLGDKQSWLSTRERY